MDEVHLWYTTLHAAHAYLQRYRSLLDDAECERAARFRSEQDRDRYVIGHGMLRELLGLHLGEDPTEVRMERGPYGKPYIPGHPLHFNLSDTKDAVLIAITRNEEVGADIETMTRTVDHAAVSEHYFTPEEIEDIRAATESKRRFLELWTRKEAVLKASGIGIMEDLRVLRVNGARNENWITHREFMRMAAPAYHVQGFHIGAHHLVSLALAVPRKAVRAWKMH
ncbi:MAG: 4'-phosphopantetheinyl transferase superfamily protein [Flavobacteriales bacterium]|nr:4'-phosphopantetheinyl transferase superfamily protein [Flavobacteriales bacterium]